MPEPTRSSDHRDFFISYNKADKGWAEWIAWKLEEAGYTTFLQAWDFGAGANFVLEMDNASKKTRRTIAVLSPDYLEASYTHPEWAEAFADDPTGGGHGVLPVRVRECNPEGLLRQLVYIDLVGSDETNAGEILLSKIKGERLKPSRAPGFPGSGTTGAVPSATFPGALEQGFFQVPQQRNPFFTGREELLARIATGLKRTGRAALCGLGGIGKTDTAIEYAFRHRDEYKFVLWTRAESRESLVSGMVALAVALDPKHKDEKDQTKILDALRLWLKENRECLLIMDNADDLGLIRPFIQDVAGHVLITSRAQATGTTAERVEIDSLPPDEGAELLLRRARLLKEGQTLNVATATDITLARQIASDTLGALPLALDQAGAYIEETGCGLSKYRDLFRKHGKKLLERRGELSSGHPDPVAVTWKLSFENTEKSNPAAADLLRICAFLHPDSIPEEILTKGASELGPELSKVAADDFELDNAIREVLKYSLLRRDAGQKLLGIHRLVQVVIQDSMDEEECQLWATRAASAANLAFPEVEFETWPVCERLVPCAEVCLDVIDRLALSFPGVGRLLGHFGAYLISRGRLPAAESVLGRAVEILEKILEPKDLELSKPLHHLAVLRRLQGRSEEAETLQTRSDSMILGDVAERVHRAGLGNPALSSDVQASNLSVVETGINVLIKVYGPEHPKTAAGFCNVARFYESKGLFDEAEQMCERALAIQEKALGPKHPDVAKTLSVQANTYAQKGRYNEARPIFERALAILEEALGPKHPELAKILSVQAEIYVQKGQHDLAKPLLERALAILEEALGPRHPAVAQVSFDLGIACMKQEQYDEAKTLFETALSIQEEALGPQHQAVLRTLLSLAAISLFETRVDDARALLRRGLTICDALGENPNTIAVRQAFEKLHKGIPASPSNAKPDDQRPVT